MTNITTSLAKLVGGNGIISPSFLEPKDKELNPHVRQRIAVEIELIEDALKAHGYIFNKLHYRQVWKIGVARSCWLLTYQFDPFRYLILPYDVDIANIITHKLSNQ